MKFEADKPTQRVAVYALSLLVAVGLVTFGVITFDDLQNTAQSIYIIVTGAVGIGGSGLAMSKVHRGSDSRVTDDDYEKALLESKEKKNDLEAAEQEIKALRAMIDDMTGEQASVDGGGGRHARDESVDVGVEGDDQAGAVDSLEAWSYEAQ